MFHCEVSFQLIFFALLVIIMPQKETIRWYGNEDIRYRNEDTTIRWYGNEDIRWDHEVHCMYLVIWEQFYEQLQC